MSTTERDYARQDGEQERSATDWARGLPSERAPRGFLDRRRWVETKWSLKTTELLTLLVAAAGLLITTLVDEGLDANRAWGYGIALAIGYMIARGVAKAGKGTYEEN